MVGSPKPSANPNTILQVTRAAKLAAKNGVTNVVMLHSNTLKIRIFFAPNLLAQKLPAVNNNTIHLCISIIRICVPTQDLTGEITARESRQDPALVVQGPSEDVSHGDDGDGHDDTVRAVYEVRKAAQGDDA